MPRINSDDFDHIRIPGMQFSDDDLVGFLHQCEESPINTTGLHPIYETLCLINELNIKRDTLGANPNGLPQNVIFPHFMSTVLSIAENFEKAIHQSKDFAIKSGWNQMNIHQLFDDIISSMPDSAQEILPGQKINNFNGGKLAILLLALSDNIFDIISKRQGSGDLSTQEVILDTYLDEVRAKKFLLSLKAAIEKLEREKPEGIIHVLDAGCGPLPVFGMYAALCSSRVKSVCLEVNPSSAKLALKAVQKLGLSDCVEVINADATTYKVRNKPDLLISETLYSGLASEPFVKIMDNLHPQINSGGIVIPEEVKIFGGVTTFEDHIQSSKSKLIGLGSNPVVDCNWQFVKSYKPGDRLDVIDFHLNIPEKIRSKEVLAFVSSEVICFGDRVLNRDESLITASGPLSMMNQGFAPLRSGANSIHVRYAPGCSLIGAIT